MTTTPWTLPATLNLARARAIQRRPASAPAATAWAGALGRGRRRLARLVGRAFVQLRTVRQGLLAALAQHVDSHCLADRRVGDDARQGAGVGIGLPSKPVTRSPLSKPALARRTALGHIGHQRARVVGRPMPSAISCVTSGCARRSSRAAPRRTGATAPPHRAPDWREWQSRCRRCRRDGE